MKGGSEFGDFFLGRFRADGARYKAAPAHHSASSKKNKKISRRLIKELFVIRHIRSSESEIFKYFNKK